MNALTTERYVPISAREVCADQPTPATPIDSEITHISKRIDTLKGAVGELHKRLNPVLRPAMPQSVNNANTPKVVPSEVPMAITLNRQAAEIGTVLDEVTDLLNRLGI